MNKYEINLTCQFKEELDNIYSYIYSSLKSPIVAKNFYIKIKKSILNLKYFPERHPFILDYNLRKLIIKNFIIIYTIDENTMQVFILHIFHCSQDYINKL